MAGPTSPEKYVPGMADSIRGLGNNGGGLTSQKQNEVASAADAKRISMAGPDAWRVMAEALDNGNDLAEDPTLQLLASGNAGDIALELGESALLNAGGINRAIIQNRSDRTAPRTGVEKTVDAVLGTGAGLVQSLGGMAAFGMGAALPIVGDEMGAAAADLSNRAAGFLRSGQSEALERKRELGAIRDDLNQEDINRQYEADVAEGDTVAGLRRFGREVGAKASDLWENPALAGDITAEGIGSFIGSAGIMKIGAQAGAKLLLRTRGITGKAAEQALKSAEGRALVRQIATKGMPASIGVMEGGGTYAQIQGEIQAMTEAELMEGSEEYRALREQGESHEAARNEIANAAAVEGGAIMTLVGMGTGKLVAKFEAAPLTRSSSGLVGQLREMGGNVIKETVEEGAQSVSSDLISNYQIQKRADDDREVSAGLGGTLVEGAVGGAGMAGVIQGPQLAVAGAVGGAKAALGGVGRAFENRLESIRTSWDDASPVGNKATFEASTNAQARMEELEEGIAEEAAVDLSEDSPTKATSEKVARTIVMTGDELNSAPEGVRRLLMDEGEVAPEDFKLPRIQALMEVVKEIQSGERDSKDLEEAALWLFEQAETFKAFNETDIASIPEKLRGAFEKSQMALNDMLENEAVKNTVERARKITSEDLGPMPVVNAQSVNTPEVQNALNKQILLAQANPAGIDPDFVDAILDQRAQGNPQLQSLRPRVLAQLQAAAAIAREANQVSEQKAQLEEQAIADEERIAKSQKRAPKKIDKTVDIVRKEILQEGNNNDAGQWGLSRHLSEIVGAVNSGNAGKAQTLLNNLKNFAKHQENKIRAAEESLDLDPSDNRVAYDTWTGAGWVRKGKGNANTIYANPFSPNSMLTAREATLDARTVRNLYNNLLTIYGDTVQGETLPELTVDPRIETRATGGAVTAPATTAVDTAVDTTTTTTQEAVAEEVSDVEENVSEAEEAEGTDASTESTPEGETDPEGANEAAPAEGDPVTEGDGEGNDGGDSEAVAEETQEAENQKFLDHLNSLGAPDKVREMNAKAKAAVRAKIQPVLDELDLPDLVEDIVLAENENAKVQGFAFWNERVIAVNPHSLENLESDPEVFHMLVHEIFHMVDHVGIEGELKLTSSDDKKQPYHVLDGELYLEIWNAANQDETWKDYFSYAMSFKTYDEVAHELFAEAATLAYLNPGVAWETLPENTYFVNEVLKRAGSTFRIERPANTEQRGPVDEETESEAVGETDEGTPPETDADGDSAPDAEVPGESDAEAAEVDFGNLAQGPAGKSRFNEAYGVSTDRSTIIEAAEPAAAMVDVIENWGEEQQEEAKLTYGFDVDQRRALGKLIKENVPAMVQKVNQRLKTKQKTTRNMTPLEFLKKSQEGEIKDSSGNPIDATNLKELRALAIVDPETGAYDPRLLETAMLAGMHWAMNRPAPREMKLKDIAQMFGVEEQDVTPTMVQVANMGLTHHAAKESLAPIILEFWGAEINSKAPMSDTLGIAQSVAAEVLLAMEGRFLTQKSQDVERGVRNGTTKTLTEVRLANGHKSTQDLVAELKAAKMFLRDVSVPGADKAYYFDEKPADVKQRQKGNQAGELSDQMKKVLSKHQDLKFKRNTEFVQMLGAMGKDFVLGLLGHEDLNEARTNKVDRLSIEGKNNSLNYSWEGVMAHNTHLESYADLEGKNPDEVSTQFDWYVVSNERIHAEGFNPQSDKMMREAFVSTIAELDLSTDEGDTAFWLTVAQSSGLVKTEKVFRKDGIEKAQNELLTNYRETINVLKEWMGSGAEMSQGEKDTIQNELFKRAQKSDLGNAVTSKLLHSLIAVARYELAFAEGLDSSDVKNFRHNLSLEADGKTDGPINAMMHFMAGEFDESQLTNLAKGGFFPGEIGKSLNEHYLSDKDDLYQTAANLMQSRLEVLRDSIDDPKAKAMMDALLRMLVHFGDLNIDENGDVIIGRNTLKNPLTITVYGSGKKGIAGKIAQGLMETVYKNLTKMERERVARDNPDLTLRDMVPEYPEVFEDLRILFTNKIVKYKKDGELKWFITPKVWQGKEVFAPGLRNLGDGVKFEFGPLNQMMFSENILQLFVEPMDAAIDELMGTTRKTTKKFQAAAQIQSVLMMDRFRKEVDRLLDQKRESGDLEKGSFLSREDYDGIFRKLRKFGAIVEPVDSNAHHLNLSNKERAQSKYELSGSIDGGYRGLATMASPSEAGVKISPLLTISRGDAMMMVNYYASEWASERTLPVFDGLEVAGDQIEDVSMRINQAVSDAWLENPAQDVADSYADFLRQHPEGLFLGLQNASGLESIFSALNGVYPGMLNIFREAEVFAKAALNTRGKKEPGETASQAEREAYDLDLGLELIELNHNGMMESMEELGTMGLRNALLSDARSIQARKNVLKRLGFSVDHMASGESPYTHEGVIPEGDLLEWMRDAYEEELAKIPDRTTSARPAIEKPTKEFKTRVEAYGEDLGDGVIRMDRKSLALMMDTHTVSPETKQIFQGLMKTMPEFTFLFGTKKDLTAFRNKSFPERKGTKAIQNGQIDPRNGVVYISNIAGETVLHEALHTVLLKPIFDFYSGNVDALSDTQTTALNNLESLMNQFRGMDFSNEDAATMEAAFILAQEIEENLAKGTVEGQATALNEFLAWSLSNQNLIEVMRKSKVRTPLKELVYQVVKGIRTLLGLAPEAKLDMFSNIALNTGALVTETNLSSVNDGVMPNLVLNQVSGRPNDLRLQRVLQDFNRKVASHLKNRDVKLRETEKQKVAEVSAEAVNLFTSSGFPMDAQQVSAFRSIQQVMASSMDLDSKALVRVQRLFTHVTKQLNVESFMRDPEGDDPGDRYQAQEKFNVLTGKYGTMTDTQNRSNLMASFLALSQVDPDFRDVLRKIDLPKDTEISSKGVDGNFDLDQLLTTTAESLMNSLSTKVSGEGRKSRNTADVLDRLAVVIAKIEEDDRSFVEKKAQSLLSEGDSRAASFLSKVGESLGAYADRELAASNRAQRKMHRDVIAQSARLISGLVNESRGKAVASALTSLGNQTRSIPTAILEVMNDVIGITDENKGVFMMLNRVKYAVSGMRQDYRESLPRLLKERFSRKLSDAEWSDLHMVLGKADVAALGEVFSTDKIREMLTSPLARRREIEDLRIEIQKMSSVMSPAYFRKADELARFMVTGEIDPANFNLLRNAEAIARLLGEPQMSLDAVDPALVEAIDRLTTLLALDKMGDLPITTVQKLAETEADGVDFLVLYLTDLRRKEKKKTTSDAALLNGYKGFIPSERQDGSSLIVADDSEFKRLASLGYTRLGDYPGSGIEGGRRSYYYSTVAGSNTYHQGVMQTVQTSAFGVDPQTGRSVTGRTAGVIKGNQVAIITQRVQQGAQGRGEPLMPVYNDEGEIVAWERSMAPERLQAMQPNTNLGEMIGAWAGRQAEEELAQGYNQMLVDRLKAAWDEGKRTRRASEFVNLADPDLKDVVYKDAWKVVPVEMRKQIEGVFGEGQFYVRRDMINNAVGYREASVADAWLGTSRMDDKTRKHLQDAATVVLGKNAFKYLVTAEKAWQAGISVAKNTIVIRSVIVPVSNLGSNFIQLLTIGVNARDIAKGFTSKLVEINQHLKNLERKVEIEALMARHRNDSIRMSKLQTELKSLDDSNRRMSIWPLIEAGEFSTISEGLTEADAAINQGKWADWMQSAIDKVPSQLGTVGRYAVITRDTALFKGMSRAVQYGDFLAKAVMYDHMTKVEGVKGDAALEKVTEEFVNYNLLPGRTRSYAESMGLTWFWAYKLRSIKIAHRHLRDNPFRALLATAATPVLPDMPGVSVGSPITDNFLATTVDGRIGYSIGWGMLWNAPSLNPWINIAN